MLKKYKSNKLLLNITSLGSATFINAVLSLFLGIITRNILGPEQYGYWLTVSLVFTFIPIFQLGTLNAMNREVPYFLVRKDFKRVQEIRETVFSFIFTIPFLLVLILLLVSVIMFFLNINFEYKIGFLFVSFIAWCTFLSNYVEMYYKSDQNFKKVSQLISVKSISQSVLTVILVYFIGYIGLYLGLLLALLIEIFMANKIFPKFNKKYRFVDYKKLIKIGFPILLVGLVWSIMIATDRMIITAFMSPLDLGNYGVGMMVFNALMLFPQVISQVTYPKVVGFVSKGDFSEIKRFYWKVNKLLAIIMLIIVIVGYLALPFFITWFMPVYTEGIKAAQILIIGIYPLTLVNMAANYFNSTNNQKTYLLIQIMSITLNVLLSIIFLSFYKSITSVALATSLSFIIYSILMNTFFWVKIRKN